VAQFEADKGAVILQSEQIIAKFTDRNRQLRRAIKELTFSAEQRQEENRELLDRVSGLEHQHCADRQELDSKNEEILGEKQLIEAKSRALVLQIEAKYQTMAEDLKTKCRRKAEADGSHRQAFQGLLRRATAPHTGSPRGSHPKGRL
jgi:hypothetical protein